MESAGIIFDIQKFCINDGPGIRTTVFFKGCPLDCAWCHNPESKIGKREILYNPKKCIPCGRCVQICPQGCHVFDNGMHIFDRQRCNGCAACTQSMCSALQSVGYLMSAENIVKEVVKDRVFYDRSGGGMTVSGGEPMMQFDFLMELLAQAKSQQLHICMETCGFAPGDKLLAAASNIDLLLFDYKLTDDRLHKKYTGVSNRSILENLTLLDKSGIKTILRCPIIPSVNDTADHFDGIANTANALENVGEIHILPYHPLGAYKYKRLGRTYPFTAIEIPDKWTVQMWIDTVQAKTKVLTRKG